MTFANPHMLWLLLVFPPALLAFFWWSARSRERLMTQFIRARLLPGLVKGVSAPRQKLRAVCLTVAVSCLVLALARPQWGYELEEVSQHGLDIVVAIDTSKSMLATDITPNRLGRAKLAALDLMQQAKSDRLGLVAFAGGAFLQCPLTVDDSAFRQSVELLDVNVIPQGGTALAEAIDTALTAFKEGGNYKVLVLFTDGEDHDSNALDAAKRAAEAGLRIFTIGIGSVEGELLPQDQVRDEQGNVVKSRLNDDLLRKIAGEAKGFYLPLRGVNTIDTLYQQGLAPLPKSEGKETWMKRPHERYHWPLALGIGLLIFEVLFPERRSLSRRSSRTPLRKAGSQTAAPAVAAALLLLAAPNVFGSPSSALREYKSGKYDEAFKHYEQLLERRKDDPRLHFNAGAAAYREQRYDDAMKHLDEALRSPDLKLQEQAYYNRGNTFYQLGESSQDQSQRSAQWEKSLKDYESTLKLNSQDADAKFNHDFVKRKLEELKQQQQQQQSQNQQQQKQDQQSKQDQQQQSQNNQQQQQSGSPEQDQKKDSQQQQADKQNQPDQNQQSQQAKADENKKQDQQQQNKQSAGQESKDQEQNGQSDSAPTYAEGQMTPQQARQLLDAQKGEEKVLPVKPEQKAARRSVKDW